MPNGVQQETMATELVQIEWATTWKVLDTKLRKFDLLQREQVTDDVDDGTLTQ